MDQSGNFLFEIISEIVFDSEFNGDYVFLEHVSLFLNAYYRFAAFQVWARNQYCLRKCLH